MSERKKPTNRFTRARAKRWFARMFPEQHILRYDGDSTFLICPWWAEIYRDWEFMAVHAGSVSFGRFTFVVAKRA